jgi:hypothetical protein
MSDLLTIPLTQNAARGRVFDIDPDSMSTSLRERIPFFVARQQLYYWTRDWQAGEADALRDLKEGRFRTFPDGSSAAQWLLRDED